MKELDVTARVEKDGEIVIQSDELKAGQEVDVKLVIRNPAKPRRTFLEIRGIFKGTWGSAEAIDQYINEERDSWER